MKNKEIDLTQVSILGESYFRISNHDQMDPFFMSIVSDGNHWMFVSSNGGLTAGRKNSDFALFPYYTDDKLTELADTTGSKTIFRVSKSGSERIWEPFSIRNEGVFQVSRNLYKNLFGNKILFEEINHDLGLTFRYQWSSSNQFGFVRTSHLTNDHDESVEVELLDGIQNIMPYGVSEGIQGIRSNLVDAYKRSELEAASGVGIYALSAIIVDRAEPSEALRANISWSIGLDDPKYLLSSKQLDAFRQGGEVVQEEDVKAKKGSYFVSQHLTLGAAEEKEWSIIANVNQGPSDVAELISQVKSQRSSIKQQIVDDIDNGTSKLKQLVAASDGFQLTADDKVNARHYSNTLFNIMRGGIFDNNYEIEKRDFVTYLKNANVEVYESNQAFIQDLTATFNYQELKDKVKQLSDLDLKRLSTEYLPLKFSRRHGDPSRPWNKFSINTRNEVDGSKILDYEGNWRDIFQNWEALAHSYPDFIEGMIFKFLNASTFDGYNPYRVTKGGFDWEVIEEHDPWSYIGYWGDHQIIYLLKFLEFVQDYFPGKLNEYFNQSMFVYANVPYKIKSYEETLANPKDTILFDYELDHSINGRRDQMGADGALICDASGKIHRVSFLEKILATVLAKFSNFIPEAGIWLNTQRPEWNDANNALVGNGVSMVTLYYLRRFLAFLKEMLSDSQLSSDLQVSSELLEFFHQTLATLKTHQQRLEGSLNDNLRKKILDGLGQAGSDYRTKVYNEAFSGTTGKLTNSELNDFVEIGLQYLEHSIRANKREDNMYHAYNLMTVENDEEVSVGHLDVMLEGQVAVLSSKYLSAQESLDVLDAMKQSKLFRQDQYSYLLYPNKELPKFLVKNIIPEDSVSSSSLLTQLLQDGNKHIVEQDVSGKYHFNGSFNNASVLSVALEDLPEKYQDQLKTDKKRILGIFESVFNHKAFTGRSGTFFGYEGLGSIYWHMVSKLLLAVEESCLAAVSAQIEGDVSGRLMEHYYEINAGIGVHKSPQLYGAFPIDPYSHTPTGKGAQQPGMTGQVKEDILSRMGELGVSVSDGCLQFKPYLLKGDEFLTLETDFTYTDVQSVEQSITVGAGQLAFMLCQIPIIYQVADTGRIEVHVADGSKITGADLTIDEGTSQQIFSRSGDIKKIIVSIPKSNLR